MFTTIGNCVEGHLTDIVCPECGKKAKCETGVILTSYPPKYSWHCEHCGKSGYIFCNELVRYAYVEPVTEIVTACMICGANVIVPVNYRGYGEICDECKRTIAYMKDKMHKEENQ